MGLGHGILRSRSRHCSGGVGAPGRRCRMAAVVAVAAALGAACAGSDDHARESTASQAPESTVPVEPSVPESTVQVGSTLPVTPPESTVPVEPSAL